MFWINGDYQQTAQVVDIADRGFLLGDGVFETILVRNGVGAFLDQHLERLRIGLDALEIPVQTLPDIENIIARLAAECLHDGNGAARFTISRGTTGRGLVFASKQKTSPTMLVTIQPGLVSANDPMSVTISKYCRAEKSISAHHKTLNYLDNILARNEAMSNGVDDAVMLNSYGRIACASAANIFSIDQHGAISTPPLVEGALPGIVRGQILQAEPQIGVTIREMPFEANILEQDFIFLTNSLIGIRQVVVAGASRAPNTPNASETFQRLQSWYENCLSENIARKAGNS